MVKADTRKSKTNLERIDSLTNQDIEKAIAADPDAVPDLSKPHPGIKRTRGPQKAQTKKLVSVRLSEEVIEHFKADGPGWQTRMNVHLEQSIKKKPKLSSKVARVHTNRKSKLSKKAG